MKLNHNGIDMNEKRLKDFTDHQWGSIVGQENDIRIAVLKEEILLWEERLNDKPDDIPYLGYIRTTLKDRVTELEKNG
jgi:hypothetical protein